MKKQIISAAFSAILIGTGVLSSCSSEKKENEQTSEITETSKDNKGMLLSEVDKLFAMIGNGITIGSPMNKITSIDKEATEFIVDGKPVGNFNAKGENEQIEWSRFYSKIDANPDQLYEIRFWAADKSINGEVEAGKEDAVKGLDLSPVVEKINELTKVKFTRGNPGDFDENNYYWQTESYFCWLESGGPDSFYIYIRKEKP